MPRSWPNDSHRYLKLSPYDLVLSKIRSSFASYSPKVESVQVDQAYGRISAEDVRSLVEIPSRTIAAMDGYAVRSGDLLSATSVRPISLAVRGSVYPDQSRALPLLRSHETYYVATGAPLPKGADAVVRVEESVLEGDTVMVRHSVPKGRNVANKGEDIAKGYTTVSIGQVLSPVDVALLIGIGKALIKVYNTPIVGLLSVGNELREFNRDGIDNSDGRITNNYLNLLYGYINQFGARAISLGACRDDPRSIQRAVLSGLREKRCDAIFTISGSSVGRHDNVFESIRSIPGSTPLFHGLRVVPIRPSGLVLVRDTPVLIVPGHAVSAILTFFVVGLPVLNRLSGLGLTSRRAFVSVETKKEITNDRAIDALFLVKLEADAGNGKPSKHFVDPLSWGSNLLSNLSKADGFVWLSPHQTVKKGEAVTVQLLSPSPISKDTWSSSAD